MIMKQFIHFSLFVLGLMASPLAQARDTLRISSLEEALRLVEQRNSGLEASRLRHKASQELRATAYELPRLEIEGQYGQMDGYDRDLSVQVKQSLPFPTVFGAKLRLLGVRASKQGAELEVAQLDLINQVRTAYETVRYQEHRARAIAHFDSTYTDYVRLSELRQRSGIAKSSELRLSQLKQGQIARQMEECLLDLAAAYNTLKSLIGHRGELVVKIDQEFKPLHLLDSLLEHRDLERNPALKVSALEIEEARSEHRELKASLLPEIILGYENSSAVGMHEVGGRERWHGLGSRFSSYSVGLAIPLDLGASRAKSRALKLETAARVKADEQLRLDLISALTSATEDYRMRSRQYTYYLQDALPLSEEVLRVADKNFRTGEISYLEYLEALETMTEVRLSYLESCYELSLSVIKLHSLINK